MGYEFERILFVGDTHSGGAHGLWPSYWLGTDRPYTSIHWLWKQWEKFCKEVPEVDLLVLMGDMIEGANRLGKATGLVTAELDQQVAGCTECFQLLKPKVRKGIIRVIGTPYHEGFSGVIKILDGKLGVTAIDTVFDIETPEGILNVAHHPSGGGALYKGTKLNKEAVWNAMASTREKVPLARIIVRAHLHYYGLWEDQKTRVISVPCWKAIDFHGAKGNLWAWQPDIGAVMLELGASGYETKKFLYDPPSKKIWSTKDLMWGGK